MMRGPSDVKWYVRISEVGFDVATAAIVPAFDAETVRVLDNTPHQGS
jgi:hypothetical protein